MNSPMKSTLPSLMAMASMFGDIGGYYDTPIKKKPYIKPEQKCLLNSCENMTTHNGGYCCSEHAKDSKNGQN